MSTFTTNLHLEKPDFNVITWHNAMWNNFDIIDATVKAGLGLTGIVGLWGNSILYSVGNRVIDADTNSVWLCVVAHQSADTGTFAADRVLHPSYWSTFDVGFSIRGAWATATAYNIGDVVYDTTEHVVATCIVSHISTDIRADQAVGKWAWIADLKDDVLYAHTNSTDAFPYTFSTITTDADPGDGKFQLNNASFSSATMMFLDNNTNDGQAAAAAIDTFDDAANPIKGFLTIRSRLTASIRQTFQITGAVVNAGGYRKVPVAFVAGSGTVTNNMECFIMFARAGDQGAAGPGSGDVLAANNGTEFVAATFRTNLSIYSKTESDNNLAAYAFARPAKTTMADADTINMTDSAATNVDKKITWANFKAAVLAYVISIASLWSARQVFVANATGNSGMATATGGLGEIEVRGNGTGAAMMTFHRPGPFASYFGVDTDNVWKVGGWSMGANAYKIWHAGNDGAGSGLDADLLDGLNASVGNTASTVAVRDAQGDLQLRLARVEFTGGGGTGAYFLTQNAIGNSATDNYSRPMDLAGVRQVVNGNISTGDIGSYAFLKTATAVDPGGTLAGSSLLYSNSGGTTIAGAPAGTWRCMGFSRSPHVTLWLRIS